MDYEGTIHNESLIKERQQSKMKLFELKKINNQLDANLKQIKSVKIEIEQKLEEIFERLRITKEKNLELHNVISKIDEEL